MLVLLAGWPLFAFAHSYRLTMVPLALGIVLLAVLRPPAVGRRPARLLDCALLLSLLAIALQLVPLSSALRARVDPAAVAFDRAMRFNAAAAMDGPLSVAPGETVIALGAAATLVLLFWCTRTALPRGAVRTTVRGIAWLGLLVTPLAILHHLMPLPGLDEVWGITSRGLRPYGPFVNRNDLAGWLIMAIPVTIGYAIARIQSRYRAGDPLEPEIALDSTSIWLGMTACLMVGGLLFSLSRSGLLGAIAGCLCFAWFARRRFSARRALWASVGLVAMLGIGATYADLGAFASRFESSFADGLSGRFSIWGQTIPVVRDFWPWGSGAGTYQTTMVVYQTLSRYFHVTHADNEFLQVLAEGGMLLGAPVAVALAAGVIVVRKRLMEDRTPIFWLRAGAAAGMVALGVQNMVEMTLRVPANAVLFSVLAAIAVHEAAPQK